MTIHQSTAESMPGLRPGVWVWLALCVLTLVTFFIGEQGLGGRAVALAVLGIAFLKAQLVADYFMGLRQVAWRWRGLMQVYLLILSGILAMAYWLAAH